MNKRAPTPQEKEEILKRAGSNLEEISKMPVDSSRYFSWNIKEFELKDISDNAPPMYLPKEDFMEITRKSKDSVEIHYHDSLVVAEIPFRP